MLQESFESEQPLRAPCPPGTCDCGYYSLVHNSDEAFIGPEIRKFQGLTITKKDENEIVENIKNTVTFEEFNVLRDALRRDYGITFLIGRDGRIKVDGSGGLCRKTREKVRKSFRDVFTENQPLLITILNRDSLFSEERE